jgi:molybdopterin molybdotransferase
VQDSDTGDPNSARQAIDVQSVSAAQERILQAIDRLAASIVPLDQASGLVLAQDVVAGHDNPPFDNSAMDGYACRAVDIAGATCERPVMLPVTAEIMAGTVPSLPLAQGAAARIMTGAPVPLGADVVVPFEETDEGAAIKGMVGIHAPRLAQSNVRRKGEDFSAGEQLLSAGTRVGPSQIALLASLGFPEIAVVRRPRVGVLTTGNEVVDPGQTLKQGQIWDSNGPAIAALIEQAGAIPVRLGIARDNAADVRQRLSDAQAAGLDLLITSGGVSAGDYDLVKEVLRASGDIAFWSVRIKPGKPLAFGLLDGLPLIGLPGNPVAGMIAFLQFARPALMKMLGRTDLFLPEIEARLLDRLENRGGRRNFMRVRVEQSPDGWTARSTGAQGSAQLSTMARANGLLIIPEEIAVAEPGMRFQVQMPGWEME